MPAKPKPERTEQLLTAKHATKSEPARRLLTVKETAKYLRLPLPTVYYLVQRGQLPAIQIGGRWRIKKQGLRAFTTEQKEAFESVSAKEEEIQFTLDDEIFASRSSQSLSNLASEWDAISDSLSRIETTLNSVNR